MIDLDQTLLQHTKWAERVVFDVSWKLLCHLFIYFTKNAGEQDEWEDH